MIRCLRAERLRLMNKVQLWVLQESCLIKSGMGSPDWHVSMFDTHLRKHCGCTALDMAK